MPGLLVIVGILAVVALLKFAPLVVLLFLGTVRDCNSERSLPGRRGCSEQTGHHRQQATLSATTAFQEVPRL
jgi:hypothetical protein